MLEALNQLDTQLFLWVNGHNGTALDWVMWTFSQHWCWAFVLLLFFCLVTLRHERRRWWVILVGIVLCFLVADQGSVHIFKDTVCRLRPCHALENVNMFRTTCGGQYGFVSSHAANAFAIVMFLFLSHRRQPVANILMLLWALVTCYSRIYIGKHYPGDVLCGAIFGIGVGAVVHVVTSWLEKKFPISETI